MAKKMIIPRIDIPIMEANGNMSMAWYLFLSYLLSKSGEGGGGGGVASDARISLIKDGAEIGHFTLNQDGDKTIDFTATDAVLEVNGKDGVVELTAEDVSALPDTTKYGNSVVLSLDSTNYQITALLKDQDGNTLNESAPIDLPLESVVVGGRYDSATQKLIFTLQNGTTFDVPVGDLVAGLQTEITESNKLSADLVDDTSATHKFVTTTEKNTWNAKQNAINDLSTIRSNAQAGKNAADTIAEYGDIVSHDAAEFQTALSATQILVINSGITAEKVSIYDGYAAQIAAKQDTITDLATIRSNASAGRAASTTIAGYGDIVTHNVSEFATAAQGGKADTAVQPGDLATVATTGQYSDLSGKPTIPTVNNPTITFKQGSTTVATMTLNQQGNQTITFAAGGSGSFLPDGVTINTTSGGEAQTIAVKNQNTATGATPQIKIWDGSGTEYEAQREAQTLDNNTLCVVKNVSNGADFGSITDEADIGADWGSVTESPGPVTNMALRIGDYVLGTEQDIY